MHLHYLLKLHSFDRVSFTGYRRSLPSTLLIVVYNPQDPENSKDCKVKKVVLPQPSALEKVVLSTPQTIDRLLSKSRKMLPLIYSRISIFVITGYFFSRCKRTPVSNKTVAKPTFVGLNFKCDERAERRKEARIIFSQRLDFVLNSFIVK